MTTVAEKEAAENLADILYAEWLGTGVNYDAWIAVAFKAIAELGARAEKAEQERDEFRSQAALFQSRVAQLERPMTTVDEDGRVWRLVPATRTNIDEWPRQDPEDPIVLFRRLPLEDGE